MNPKRPKITPSQLNLFTEPVIEIYRALEEEIFLMVAKRLKTSDDITKDTVFQWQIDKMNQLRLINTETIKLLSKTTGIAEKEIREAIKNTGIETIKSVDYELDKVYDPLSVPSHIDRVLEQFVKGTFKEYNNYVNQSLITTTYGQGTVTDMYRRIIETTTGKVLAGTKTVNQAVTETVIEWANRGVNTGFVDRVCNVWSLDRYAKSFIRSTVNNTYNNLIMSRKQQNDVNLVLVSSLPDPREACSHIQGKVLTLEENSTKYQSVWDYGYGEPW